MIVVLVVGLRAVIVVLVVGLRALIVVLVVGLRAVIVVLVDILGYLLLGESTQLLQRPEAVPVHSNGTSPFECTRDSRRWRASRQLQLARSLGLR